MKKTEPISVRVTAELDEALERIADQYKITKSHLICAVLTSFVDQFVREMVEDNPFLSEN